MTDNDLRCKLAAMQAKADFEMFRRIKTTNMISDSALPNDIAVYRGYLKAVTEMQRAIDTEPVDEVALQARAF